MKSILILVAAIKLALTADWSYGEKDALGPASWASSYALCGGVAQTPINIEASSAVCDSATLNIAYLNDAVKGVTLVNDGHTVVFNIDFLNKSNKTLQWSNEGSRTYIFHSAHLHWGPQCTGGSEHTINGHRYAAELHLVHYNSIYSDLSQAAPKPDGLAVVGILLELAEESNNDGTHRNHFTTYLSNIGNPKSTYTIPDPKLYLTIKDLIKNNVKNFYSYKGSLTTPPCYESVRWFVSTDTIRIYPSELEELIKIYPMNYRPIQKGNGRTFAKEYRNGCQCRC